MTTTIVFASSREAARKVNNDLKAQGHDSKLYDGNVSGKLGANGERWGAIYEVATLADMEAANPEVFKHEPALPTTYKRFTTVQELMNDLDSDEPTEHQKQVAAAISSGDATIAKNRLNDAVAKLDSALATMRKTLGYTKPPQSGKRPAPRLRGQWSYEVPAGMHGKPYQEITTQTL